MKISRPNTLFTIIFIMILAFSSNTSFGQYCTPAYAADDASIYSIDTFICGEIRMEREGDYGEDLYLDYSNDYQSILPAGDSISFSAGFGYWSSYSGHFALFIDLNDDGDFDDANELVAAVSEVEQVTGKFLIPTSAVRSKYLRMRARHYSAYDDPPNDACYSYDNGQTIDFSVYVLGDNEALTKFSANRTNVTTLETVDFTDESYNNISSWLWVFEGGMPSTSTAENPKNIRFTKSGCYQVSLTTTVGNSSDTETKSCYINVTANTRFTASDTTVTTIDYVNFNDFTKGIPDSWSWTFEGGEPSSSSEQFPKNVIFREPGCYEVLLATTINEINDTAQKTCYIEVTEAPAGADFACSDSSILAGESIDFYDSSAVVAASWEWYIDSAIVFSTVQNPEDVKFNSAGEYEISLKVVDYNNIEHYITKKRFITVQNAQAINELSSISSYMIFPNPSSGSTTVTYRTKSSETVSLKVIDIQGKLVQEQIQLASTGSNHFNIELLDKGVYFVQLQGSNDMQTKRLIVQ